MSNTVFAPLLTKKDVNGFRWKATSLKALAAREPSAANPEIAEAIQLLLEFYEDAELAMFDERTPDRVAEWDADCELAAQMENMIIDYLIVNGENKARVERESSKWI